MVKVGRKKEIAVRNILKKQNLLSQNDYFYHKNPKVFGVCWYYIACSPEKGRYPGLKDCRVLEYDTEQQVYG